MRRYRRFGYGFWFIILMAVLVGPVWATEPSKEKDLGAFGDWRAYAYEEGGQTVCYMTVTKLFGASKNNKGRLAYLMVTHRPLEASLNVFSYGAGVPLDSNHDVTLEVGEASFDLFSVKDNAWARDPRIDRKIADALSKHLSARVLAIPGKKGISTIKDSFSLKGADAAYNAIGKACGLPDPDAQKEKLKKPEKVIEKKAPVEKKKVLKTDKTQTKKAAAPTSKAQTSKTSKKKDAPSKKTAVKKTTAKSTPSTKADAKKKTSSKETPAVKSEEKKTSASKSKASK